MTEVPEALKREEINVLAEQRLSTEELERWKGYDSRLASEEYEGRDPNTGVLKRMYRRSVGQILGDDFNDFLALQIKVYQPKKSS
jgi:hypothetical protein